MPAAVVTVDVRRPGPQFAWHLGPFRLARLTWEIYLPAKPKRRGRFRGGVALVAFCRWRWFRSWGEPQYELERTVGKGT